MTERPDFDAWRSFVRPRLTLLVMPPILNVIALICIGLGLMTFPLVVLPAGAMICYWPKILGLFMELAVAVSY